MFKALALATVLAMTGSDCKRHLDDTEFGRRIPIASNDNTLTALVGTPYSPLVQGTDCTPMCLFKDAQNSFCWKFQSPMLTAGYDW